MTCPVNMASWAITKIYLIQLGISLVCGLLIGAEREWRGKSAGISTHCFVIAGAMTFTYIGSLMNPHDPGRIAAQVVSGIGFLGAGIILRGRAGGVINVTTAASVWFSAAIGMAIGFQWWIPALAASVFSVIVPQLPRVSGKKHG